MRRCRGRIKLIGMLTATLLLYLLIKSNQWKLTLSRRPRPEYSDNGLQNNNISLETRPTNATFTNKSNEAHNLLMSLANLDRYPKILKKFKVCLSSLCRQTNLLLQLHIVTDEKSQKEVKTAVKDLMQTNCKGKIDVLHHGMTKAANVLKPLTRTLNKIFTGAQHSYYSGTLFFLSMVSHILFPNLSRLIILDVDMKFHTDVKDLFAEFEKFSRTNIMGLAHEQQPVYKHITWKYRKNNPGTKIGEPAPDGLPGFNSGVVLLDLNRMRNSEIYRKYIENSLLISQLSQKYYFRDNLGDQGFYSLLSFEYPEMFYVLPCTWNRQLCVWWRNKGYEKVFDLYHKCSGVVKIYHGNCDTPIPDG